MAARAFRAVRGWASKCASGSLRATGFNSGSVPELERGEPPEGVDLFGAADMRAVERRAHDFDRFVVGRAVDREGRAVLAAVGEGVARGIAVTRARAVDEL